MTVQDDIPIDDARISEGAELIKPPQHRGRGISTVYVDDRRNWDGQTGRVYVKRQHRYTCRPAWRGFRSTPTFARELRALTACSAFGLNIPEVIDYTQRGASAQLVIGEVKDAQSLFAALLNPAPDRRTIISNVARCISRLHTHGWTHGALNQEHILVQPDAKIALIDFEKARHNPRGITADLERVWRRNPYLTVEDRQLFEEAYASA